MVNVFGNLMQHKNTFLPWIEAIIRLLIAFTFVLSGITKGVNLVAVTQTVRNYSDLFGVTLNSMLAYAVALVVCSFEIFIGLLAFDNRTYRKLYPIYMAVILVFLFLTYVNLNSPLGHSKSCGCFGEIFSLDASGTFVKNMILLGVVTIQDVLITKCNLYSVERQSKHTSLHRYFLICGCSSLLPIVISALYMDKLDDKAFLLLYILISVVTIVVVISKIGKTIR